MTISAAKKQATFEKTEGCCFYCGTVLRIPVAGPEAPLDEFCPDHFWPRAKGGSDDLENLVPACRRCNSSKAAYHPLEWLERRRERVGFEQFGIPDIPIDVMAYLRGRRVVFPHDFLPYQFWFEMNGWRPTEHGVEKLEPTIPSIGGGAHGDHSI